jgi:predicted RNA-binding protein YlxR (DUF448 family)
VRRRADPERTCVGCRTRARKRELLRLVVDGAAGPVVDPSGSAPGRGAYVHRDDGCATAAIRTGAIARALRTRVSTEEAARLRHEIGRRT